MDDNQFLDQQQRRQIVQPRVELTFLEETARTLLKIINVGNGVGDRQQLTDLIRPLAQVLKSITERIENIYDAVVEANLD